MGNPLVGRSGRAMTPGVALYAAIQQQRRCPPDGGNLPDGGSVGDVLRVTTTNTVAWATTQTLRMAKIVSGPGIGSQQLYTVALLSPVDKSVTGTQIANCFVPDDSADPYEVDDFVVVAVQSDGADSSTYHAFIVASAGNAADVLQWAFAVPEGEGA